jgi:hypothetical protein
MVGEGERERKGRKGRRRKRKRKGKKQPILAGLIFPFLLILQGDCILNTDSSGLILAAKILELRVLNT